MVREPARGLSFDSIESIAFAIGPINRCFRVEAGKYMQVFFICVYSQPGSVRPIPSPTPRFRVRKFSLRDPTHLCVNHTAGLAVRACGHADRALEVPGTCTIGPPGLRFAVETCFKRGLLPDRNSSDVDLDESGAVRGPRL